MQFEQGLLPLDPVIDIIERFHTALIRVLPLLFLHSQQVVCQNTPVTLTHAESG